MAPDGRIVFFIFVGFPICFRIWGNPIGSPGLLAPWGPFKGILKPIFRISLGTNFKEFGGAIKALT